MAGFSILDEWQENRKFWDPPEAYDLSNPPPKGFLQMLYDLDPNLTAAVRLADGVLWIAELKHVPMRVYSKILGPDGKNSLLHEVICIIAVEIGPALSMDYAEIERLREWSPKFNTPHALLDKRRKFAEQQVSLAKEAKDRRFEMGDKSINIASKIIGDIGKPLISKEERIELEKRVEADRKKLDDSYLSQIG
jgi:hypothetical protein